MANAQSKLDILIDAKNNASPQVRSLTGDLKSMNSAAGTAANGLGGLMAAAGVAGFAALASSVASATFELGQLGAMSLQVEGSFVGTAERMGASAGELLAVMQGASRGMIAEQQLMLGANRAMILGVADSANEMGALLEVAGARAKIMGTDVATAYSDLVTGIGRMSPLILDNLGIVTGGEKAFDAYAASIGKTTQQLTDAERKQALLNLAIRDTLPYLQEADTGGSNAAESFQRFGAAATNLRTNLGELIAVKLAPWLDGITGAVNDFATIFDIVASGKQYTSWGVQGLAKQFDDIEQTTYAQQALTEATQETAAATDWSNFSFAELAKKYGEMPAIVEDQKKFTAATYATGQAASQVSAEFTNLQSKISGVLSSALNTDVGVDPDAVLEGLGIPRADAINENARRLADIAANGLKDQDWLGSFASEVPDIWQMIRTAQNPQEEAAYLLRDFQDGLLTSAIDRDKAKEIVRRQILGDRNMAQMAQEIATELAAEMGIPLQEAMAAARTGLGGGGGGAAVGTEAATAFADGADLGMQETDGGGRMVDTFVAQMRASYSKLATAGRDAGRQWGDSFMAAVGENVPPALISLLSTLVTPQVMSQFAQRGTLQGAAN